MRPLVGREREVGLAIAGLRDPGTVVLLHGPAGIGKTRLLQEALALLRRDGDRPTVLHGRANQLDADLAFAPLVDALTGHLDRLTPADRHEALEGLDVLGDLLEGYGLTRSPAGRPDDDALHRTRRLEAIRRLVSRVQGRRVLLVVDDAHWADEGTLSAVAHLSRSLGDERLTLALTYRDEDATPMLRAALATLRRAGAVVDLALTPLDDESVGAVLAAELGAAPAPSLLQVVTERAAGNSLFVTSLARHLRDRGLVRPRLDGTVELVPGADVGVPAEVSDVLALRRDDASPHARDVLAALGVADAPTAADALTAVTGLPPESVEAAVEELVSSGLVVESGGGALAPAHPLVGDAAYRALPERMRRRLHAAFVDVLEAEAATGREAGGGHAAAAGRLARHYRLAGTAVDAGRALAVLVEAADRAIARSTPREALLHAQAAVDLARLTGEAPLPPLLRRLGVAWTNLAEFSTGAAVLRAGLAAVDPEAEPALAVALLADLATAHHYVGEPAVALEHLHRAAALDPAAADAAGVPWRRAFLAYTHGLADELRAVADDIGDDATQGDPLALLIRAMAAQDQGALTDARAFAQHALVQAERLDAPSAIAARARTVLALVAALLGDHEELRSHLGPVEAHHDALGNLPARWRPTYAQMISAHLRGEDDVVQVCRDFLSLLIAEDGARGRGQVWLDLLVEAWSADVEKVQAVLAHRYGPVGERSPAERRTAVDLLSIAVARGGGSPAAIDLTVPPQTSAFMPPVNLAARALVALRAGEDPGGPVVDDLVDRLRRMGSATTVPGVLADLVDLHRHADPAELAATGTALADRCAAAGWVRLEAWVARCAAELAVGVNPGAGVDLAARALELARRLGERVDVDAASAVLRQAGVRHRVARGPSGDLTARQREIAALVATGLSNADIADRLFISVRTVTTHLDHVYQRLGISSRHDLAVRVRDGRLDDDASSQVT